MYNIASFIGWKTPTSSGVDKIHFAKYLIKTLNFPLKKQQQVEKFHTVVDFFSV